MARMWHNGWYRDNTPFRMIGAVEQYGRLGETPHTFYVMVTGRYLRVLGENRPYNPRSFKKHSVVLHQIMQFFYEFTLSSLRRGLYIQKLLLSIALWLPNVKCSPNHLQLQIRKRIWFGATNCDNSKEICIVKSWNWRKRAWHYTVTRKFLHSSISAYLAYFAVCLALFSLG